MDIQYDEDKLLDRLARDSVSNRHLYVRRLREDNESKRLRALFLANLLAELCNQAADYSDRIDLSVHGLQAGYEAIVDILSGTTDSDERNEVTEATMKQGDKSATKETRP